MFADRVPSSLGYLAADIPRNATAELLQHMCWGAKGLKEPCQLAAHSWKLEFPGASLGPREVVIVEEGGSRRDFS
jgi:hypothetical protein